MLFIYEKSYQSAIKQDATLKDLFYKNHSQSMAHDGINSPLSGDLEDFGFRFTNVLISLFFSFILFVFHYNLKKLD
jgi:hypothetical protein